MFSLPHFAEDAPNTEPKDDVAQTQTLHYVETPQIIKTSSRRNSASHTCSQQRSEEAILSNKTKRGSAMAACIVGFFFSFSLHFKLCTGEDRQLSLTAVKWTY